MAFALPMMGHRLGLVEEVFPQLQNDNPLAFWEWLGTPIWLEAWFSEATTCHTIRSGRPARRGLEIVLCALRFLLSLAIWCSSLARGKLQLLN